MFKPLAQEETALVGWGVSVLLASSAPDGGPTARRLSRLGATISVHSVLYDALSLLLDDPREADLIVIDCDHFGGLEVGRRAFGMLADARLRLPVILVTASCPEQMFPLGRDTPFVLRAPVSAVSLRIAFEAAFPTRLKMAV